MDTNQGSVEFNMRNLSISLFVNAGKLRNSTLGDYSNTDYLIELEDCNVIAEENEYNVPEYIKLDLKSSRSQILDVESKLVHDISDVNSMVLVVTEKQELFWRKIYPMFKEKTPMINENVTDLESLASFRTINSVIDKYEEKKQNFQRR